MSDGAALRCGFAALLGWSNVGKSTLLNRLVGVKLAAVSETAQTTRHRIMGVRTLPDRGQIVFLDTPGIHRPRYRMNRAMIETARDAMRSADVVLFLVDASRGPGEGDAKVAGWLARAPGTVIGVLNKVDLVRPKTRLLPMIERISDAWAIREVVPVSALTGDGCDVLLDRLVASLPEGPPLYPEDTLTDQPERVLAAEWIREKLMSSTRQELPHATAVVVDRWSERDDGLLEIEASILVDRESQKKIVIGRRGELLKQVGTEARGEIERTVERRVMLRLWVRVRQDWRNDPRQLERMGI